MDEATRGAFPEPEGPRVEAEFPAGRHGEDDCDGELVARISRPFPGPAPATARLEIECLGCRRKALLYDMAVLFRNVVEGRVEMIRPEDRWRGALRAE